MKKSHSTHRKESYHNDSSKLKDQENVSHKRSRKESKTDDEPIKKQKVETTSSTKSLGESPYQIISFILGEFPEELPSLRNLFEVLDNSANEEVTIDIEGLENDTIKNNLKLLFEKFWNDDLKFFNSPDEKGYRKASSSKISFTTEFDTICVKMLEDEEQNSNETSTNSTKKIQGPTLPSKEQKKKNEPASKVFIDEYNDKHRSQSLVELHQEEKKKQSSRKEADALEKAGYLQFDREKVMSASRKKSKEQVDKFIKESSNLDSKFDKRYQTSFL